MKKRKQLQRGQRVWLVGREGQQVSVVEGEVHYCDAPSEGDAVTVTCLGRKVSVTLDQVYLSEREARGKLFPTRRRA